MPHGAPDWSKYRREAVTYSLQDLAELAARLGSIVTFDRRGDVIHMETWQFGTARWTLTGSGPRASTSLDHTAFLSQATSLLLTGGTGRDGYASAISRIAYPGQLRMGIEASFTTNDETHYIRLGIRLWNGTILYEPATRVYPNADEIGYEDDDTTYQKAADIPPTYHDANMFHTAKFVFDLSTGEYARVLYNNIEVDLTGYAFKSSASATGAHIEISLYAYSLDGLNALARIDNIIITQDEP